MVGAPHGFCTFTEPSFDGDHVRAGARVELDVQSGPATRRHSLRGLQASPLHAQPPEQPRGCSRAPRSWTDDIVALTIPDIDGSMKAKWQDSSILQDACAAPGPAPRGDSLIL